MKTVSKKRLILFKKRKCEPPPAAFLLCDLEGAVHVSAGAFQPLRRRPGDPTWPFKGAGGCPLLYPPALCRCLGSFGVSPRAPEAVPSAAIRHVYTLQQKTQSRAAGELYSTERLADECLHPGLTNNLETGILIPVAPSILSHAAPHKSSG